MKTMWSRTILATTILGALTLATWQVHAEANRVTFPDDLAQLQHYSSLTRGNIFERMLTTPEAIAAARAGQPMPDGTQVVLEIHQDGELWRYFIMQKGEGWGEDYADATGDWQFQWFWPDRSIAEEDTRRCQSCHQSRADDEYMFTLDDMRSFEGVAP